MKGDFSRRTFDRKKHYSSVRMQQGRVQLDADWNAQMDLFDYRQRTELADFLGKSGAPFSDPGFKITIDANQIKIGKGRFYVDGLLCENEQEQDYDDQADYPEATEETSIGYYLAYIDAWQRHVTYLEDPSLREVALGGADTTTRLQNLAQVKLKAVANPANISAEWDEIVNTPSGNLTPALIENPRLRNQLYRVEIHKGGNFNEATFKWSQDNAAIAIKVIAVSEVNTNTYQGDIELDSLDPKLLANFAVNQLIEVNSTTRELQGLGGFFAQIISIDTNASSIKVEWEAMANERPTNEEALTLNTARCWNAKPVSITQNASNLGHSDFYDVQDGLQVKFDLVAVNGLTPTFKTGDYWLIPARAFSNNIEWPRDNGNSLISKAPDGIEHHYAQLAILELQAGNNWSPVVEDLRIEFPALYNLKTIDSVQADENASEGVIHIYGNNSVGIGTTIAPTAGIVLEVNGKIYSHQLQVTDITVGPNKVLGADNLGRIPLSWLGNRWENVGFINDNFTLRVRPSIVAIGSSIYMIGGVTPDGPTRRVEEYNLVTNSWSPKSSFPSDVPVNAYSPTVCTAGGMIYLFSYAESQPLPLIKKFDPNLDVWTSVFVQVGSIAAVARVGYVAVELNGKIRLMGGYHLESNAVTTAVEMFHLQSGAFTFSENNAPGFKTPDMLIACSNPTVCIANNKIYLIGGNINTPENPVYTNVVQEYDPVAEAWSLKSSMPRALGYPANFILDNKIYINSGYKKRPHVAGHDPSSYTLMYDPHIDFWEYKADSITSNSQAAGLSVDGKGYIIGLGFNEDHKIETYIPNVY